MDEEILSLYMPLLVMVALFYFMLYRPRQKMQAKHRAFVSSIHRGMRVVTSSGIIGTVFAVKDHTILLEVSEGVNIEIAATMVIGEYKAGDE